MASSAAATSSTGASTSLESMPPVFIKDRDIGSRSVTPIQVCRAITEVIGSSKLEGVQKVNNLWRVYTKDKAARLQLCVKQQIAMNGKLVQLYDCNPFVTFHGLPLQKKINNDKLTIKNLPLSVSNEEIEKLLNEKNVKLVSPVRYGLIRDDNGQATTYKSGDRYVYVESFDTPLPVQQHIGTFQCLILHHGKTMPPCKSCNRSGHKVGDERCPAKPSDTILAFRGYGHPLSNHYACDITVNGTTFKSVEHAYFHHMATEMGKHDLADDIKNACHGGVAKRLSHDIAPDEDRWAWELDNIEVMEKLLQAKLKQCPTFKQCLIESTGMVIAEATNSKIWATGMTPYVTERTSLAWSQSPWGNADRDVTRAGREAAYGMYGRVWRAG